MGIKDFQREIEKVAQLKARKELEDTIRYKQEYASKMANAIAKIQKYESSFWSLAYEFAKTIREGIKYCNRRYFLWFPMSTNSNSFLVQYTGSNLSVSLSYSEEKNGLYFEGGYKRHYDGPNYVFVREHIGLVGVSEVSIWLDACFEKFCTGLSKEEHFAYLLDKKLRQQHDYERKNRAP